MLLSHAHRGASANGIRFSSSLLRSGRLGRPRMAAAALGDAGEEAASPSEYLKLTVPQLRSALALKGAKVPSKALKSDLLALLLSVEQPGMAVQLAPPVVAALSPSAQEVDVDDVDDDDEESSEEDKGDEDDGYREPPQYGSYRLAFGSLVKRMTLLVRTLRACCVFTVFRRQLKS